MKRLTDKELRDAIEARLGPGSQTEERYVETLIAYAQLRALERLADNVFNLEQTLAVIRGDLVKPEAGRIIDSGNLLADREI
jgi:hypothetical protein